MATIQYKTVKINAPEGTFLRDYSYSPYQHASVKTDKKIGTGLENGAEIHVIDPPTYSDDNKWIQVIDKKGITGYIPKDHVNMEEVEKAEPKQLTEPYRYFVSNEEKILFKAENGLLEASDEYIKKLRDDLSRVKKYVQDQYIEILKELLDEDYGIDPEEFNKSFELKKFEDLIDPLKIHKKYITRYDNKRKVSREANTEVLDHFKELKNNLKNDEVKEERLKLIDEAIKLTETASEEQQSFDYACYQYMLKYCNAHKFERICKKSQIVIDFKPESGQIDTDFSLRDMINAGITLVSYDNPKDFDVSDISDDLILDVEDKKNFIACNRALAEATAKERLKYKQEQEVKQRNQKSFNLPESLINEVENIEIDDQIYRISKAQELEDLADELEKAQKTKDIAKIEEASNKYRNAKEEVILRNQISGTPDKLPVMQKKFFENQIKEHGGLVIGEVHSISDTRNWITKNMTSMKDAGINTIYIEHLFEGMEQTLIDSFLNDEEEKEMCDALSLRCNVTELFGMKELLYEARRLEMRVVGLASTLSQVDTSKDPYSRCLLFNQHAVEHIQKDQEKLGDSNKGYIALMGHAHTLMYEGKDKSSPIKGVPQLLNVHAFSYGDNHILMRKDPNVIQTPIKKENSDDYTQNTRIQSIENYRYGLDHEWKSVRPSEKTNFNELNDSQRKSDREIKLGSARELYQKKKLGFEEITKEDIDFVRKKEKLGFDEITDKDILKAKKRVPNKKFGGFFKK